MIDRETAIGAVQQKLIDLYGQLDLWSEDSDLRADAEALADAALDGAVGD